MEAPPIDISPANWEIVREILSRHVPDREVWAFGSRATWTAKEYSDLDLAVIGDQPLGLAVSAGLADDFARSDLPFKVDAVDWATTKESFRKIIVRDKVGVQPGRVRARGGLGAEWPVRSLRDVGVLLIDCEHRTPPAAENGYPYVAIPQVKEGRIHLNGVRRITREHFDEWTRKAHPEPDDVVLSRRCNPGETGYVPHDLEFALGQNLVLLRADGKKVIKPFLRWLVRGPQWWEQVGMFINVGAVFDSLRCADIPDFRLAIPPISEQRAIAHILGTLDEKIELNRRMNETLEAMARALFKSWFVDFEPVRAKMEGRWKRGQSLPLSAVPGTAQAGGLPAHLYDLFPDRLAPSELGEIPEGWAVRSLDAIADFQNGLALQKYRPGENEDRLPVVKIAQLRSGQADSGEWASASIRPECIIDDGDVVFSWSGSLMVKVWCGGRAALNQHLFKVTSTRYPKWFYLQCTQSHLLDFQHIAAGKATTMGHIKRHHLSEANCAVPSRPLLSAADEAFSDFLAKSISASIESRTLTTLRDTLLPKLISGDLIVSTDTVQRLRVG